MKTVARLTAECQLMNLHQYQDTDGNLRGCSGSCLGNDETTAIGNYAGDQVRILCSCECHRVIDEEDFPPLEAERIQTYQSCRCPSARCVCQGGAQCACACSVGVDPNICVVCRPDSQPGPKVRVPTHEETCAGCYEVAPGVFIHPPRSSKVRNEGKDRRRTNSRHSRGPDKTKSKGDQR
jgi:hypothetical protein